MNSNDPNFDWHLHGVWMAHDPVGAVQFGTVADTPYSSRAQLLRFVNKPWSTLKRDGWTVQEYLPTIPVLTDVIKISDQVAVSQDTYWNYPANMELAPPGVTVLLLTKGGILVRGVWNDLGDYIAWAPMIKRDKEIERKLGL